MNLWRWLWLVLGVLPAAESWAGQTHRHQIQVGDQVRIYKVYVPESYNAAKPAPAVMVLHGAAINGDIMALFTGMNRKADQAGFLVVYPFGAGIANAMLAFNAGNLPPEVTQHLGDDVAYFHALLDDLPRQYAVDRRRIYATGLSNGGMMCYRLAAELSDRIAAIAPVGGTLCLNREQLQPARAVPILHMHGLSDWIVPYDGVNDRVRKLLSFVNFKSVDETIAAWVELNDCEPEPVIEPLPNLHDDGTVITRWTYCPRRGKGEVVLYRIVGGGHTWPGHRAPLPFLGRSTQEFDANDVIWEFFQRHALPDAAIE